jgi:Fibronectin type III domain
MRADQWAYRRAVRILIVLVMAGTGCSSGDGGTTPPTIPATPTGVQVAAGDGQVTLSWAGTTGAASYNIYWSTSGGVTTANSARITAAVSPFVATGLTDGTTYYYVVTAVNSAGESPASSQVSAVPITPDTCVASTAAGLVDCAQDIQAGTRSLIEVEGALVCTGAAACLVSITGVPVNIRGADGASIRRIDHHDHPLFQVNNSPRVAITDLVIDEDAAVECLPVSASNPPVENPSCARTIDLYGVTEVSLSHLTIANSKSVAAFLNTCGSASITHVRFISPELFGLEITGLTGTLLVEDSLFWHAASNGLVLFDAHGTAQTPLLMTQNLFEHNHRADVYYTCGPQGTSQCPGGQLLISGQVDFLSVESSVIRLGSSDNTATPVGGVEINTPAVHDVTFTGNDIHTHSMWGVYVNSNPSDLARVSLVNNKFYDNGLDADYLGVDIGNFPAGVVTESGTCHSADCATVRFGALWALPGGQVLWASNDLANPIAAVNGMPVATTANGQVSAPQGATVVLFDGATLVDRLTVP